MSEKRDFGSSEMTLVRVENEMSISKFGEDLAKIGEMLLERRLGEYTDVVQEIESVLPQNISENSVHDSLIGCRSVAKSKGHD